MKVRCQYKHGSHGMQDAEFRYIPLHNGSEYVKLACGCSIPIPWLPCFERDAVLLEVPFHERKR
jgi:hypothetical protein